MLYLIILAKNLGVCCSNHKDTVMIDVKHLRCQDENCDKQPVFNIKGETKPIYCKNHKTHDMINVKTKKCQNKDCIKQPSFNIKGKKWGIYCGKHKDTEMVNVVNKRCQFEEGCDGYPIYNFKGKTKGIYCIIHKNTEMIDVVNPRCKSEWCDTQINKKYEGYCNYCYFNLFPDKPVSRNFKTKERLVADFIKTQFNTYDVIFDKQIDGGCSKKRPDAFIDLFTHSIIVEVDEDQHINYSCENKRMMELFQDLGSRNLVIIRFNPDKYIDENGKNISSCFNINKTSGLLKVANDKSWNARLKSLKETIDYHIKNIPDIEITQIKLFFDTIII
jgi:hypothetical protein